MAFRRTSSILFCLGFTAFSASAGQATGIEEQGILPASGLCIEAGQVNQQRRRPGVPVDEYQLPLCQDVPDEGRIVG